MKKIPLMAAAAVTLATAAVHAFVGGPEILSPAEASTMPDLWKATFVVIWHFITAFLLLSGLGLAWVALDISRRRAVLGLITLQQFAFLSLFLGIAAFRLHDILALPQWIAFALIIALSLPILVSPT